VVDTGLINSSYAICNRQGKDRFDDRGLSGWFAGRLKVFWTAIRHMFFRFGMIWVWLPCVPFSAVVVIDSFMQRQIRKHQFKYASPSVNYWTKFLISILVLGITLAPLAPISMSPMLVPITGGLCGVMFWVQTAFNQKRF